MGKLKLNFAKRVSVAGTAKSDSGNMYANERAKVQALTNSNPVIIDRKAFQKSEFEKTELKIAKMKWKAKLVKIK
jgi:hypothetical protein